jgi:homocysteine S-methyltransferase
MNWRDGVDLSWARVVDGGMATELEHLGADITGPLWSAHVLEDAPEKVVAVHLTYLEAGADVLLTASYQVSRKGYAEYGLAAGLADAALLRAVELARLARSEYFAVAGGRKVLIAASLGPYGAALHNGAEYTGDYACSYGELVAFHRERIAVFAEAGLGIRPDLLAFETLPSLEEARAIGEALEAESERWPELAAWFCFNCPDARAARLEVAHGELLRECAGLAAGFPQTVAVGVNCTHPKWIAGLIGELKAASDQPVVVYPNSGEDWDAEARCWIGSGDAAGFGELSREWYAGGAQMVGGCCRTRPEHIRQVAGNHRG